MAKAKTTVFFCQNCGYESAKWQGQCPACHEWNTFTEEPVVKAAGSAAVKKAAAEIKPVRLSEVHTDEKQRISSGMEELDRVLGGGIVAGSLMLVGGDPGIGKSTLLLQVCLFRLPYGFSHELFLIGHAFCSPNAFMIPFKIFTV